MNKHRLNADMMVSGIMAIAIGSMFALAAIRPELATQRSLVFMSAVALVESLNVLVRIDHKPTPKALIKQHFGSQEMEAHRLSQKYVCNRCGKELDLYDLQQEFHIHTQVGYGSIHDGDFADLRLCCECFDALVEQCSVSPITEGADYTEYS